MRDELEEIIQRQIGARIVGDEIVITHADATAKAIIAALPDMVQPLVWEETERGFWAEDFRIYNLEHKRRDVWRLIQADFGTQYRSDFGGKHGYKQAMDLANLIRTRRILSAFGITGET